MTIHQFFSIITLPLSLFGFFALGVVIYLTTTERRWEPDIAKTSAILIFTWVFLGYSLWAWGLLAF